MSNFVVALFFAGGIGAWVYNKSYKSSGGLAQKSLVVGVVVGLVVLVVVWTALGMIFSR